jgi:K+-sensing histidine kinase KdpD
MASAPFRYGLAVLSVFVALALTYVLHPEALVTPVLFLAIILSAWIGGTGPGLLAALLATLFLDYFFLEPKYTLTFDPVHIPQLLAFFVSAVLASSWSAVRRRTEDVLARALEMTPTGA